MDNATTTLIAVPAALADAVRQAAVQWDPTGADSMFRAATLHPIDDPTNLYVFSYGWIGDDVLPLIQAAAGQFPSGQVVTAHPFEAALAEAGLARVATPLSSLTSS